jgi:hypothetical protein
MRHAEVMLATTRFDLPEGVPTNAFTGGTLEGGWVSKPADQALRPD